MQKMKSGIKYAILWAVLVVAGAAFVITGAKRSFNKDASKYLEQVSNTLLLEFELGPMGQIPLVLEMSKSPITRDFLLNPDDENIKSIAMEQMEAFQNAFLSKSSFWMSSVDLDFWSDLAYSYHVDITDPSNYWWSMTVDSPNDYNFNINYNEVLKTTSLWVNAVVRDKSGKGIGMCGTGIPLTGFIDEMYTSLPAGLDLYFYNDKLEITGATDSRMIEQKTPVASVLSVNENSIPVAEKKQVFTADGVYYFVPIESVNWMMVLHQPYNIGQFFKNMTSSLVMVIIFALLLAGFQLINLLLNPLKLLYTSIEGFSSGNADLTKRIDLEGISSLKILSKMCGGFNKFLEKLQNIVSSLKNSKGVLLTTGTKLKGSADETVNSVTEIMSNIEKLESNIESQVNNVDSTAGAVHEISANIDSLDRMISEQTRSVANASSAVKEMIQNISGVNNSVGKLSNKFGELEQMSSKGVSAQQNMNDKIRQIQQQSESLQEANAAISAIAEQTNLLAMNAAIEAAHAGEAGKGFSVVADEIRKLSETSAEQTRTISSQLESIKVSIENIVDATQESSDAFASVNSGIQETNEIVKSITMAMLEQEEGSKQINAALSAVNDSTAEVNASSTEMSIGNKSILEGIRDLQETTGVMRSTMEEMTAGARKINSVTASLDSISSEVNVSIEKIGSQIDEFTV